MTVFGGLKAEVEERVRAGETIDNIDEVVIAEAPLTRDQKSALWLYAWSLQRPHVQRREASLMLAVLDA